MADDIIERLAYWRDLPHGTPLPEAGWDRLIAATCADAILEIERLRALTGPVQTEPSFRTIARDG